MVDLEEIKRWLGVTVNDYDTALTELRDRLVDRIQRRLDWYFGPPRPATEILSGNGRAVLFLRQPPVGNAVSVAYRTGRSNGPKWDVLPASDYGVQGRKLVAVGPGAWPYGVRNIQVRYLEGFVDPPGDVVQLLLDLMQANVTASSGSAGGDITSEKLGDYSYTVGSGSTAQLESAATWGDVYNGWRRGRI